MFKPTMTCRKPILTSAAMRACDDHTIQNLGIPSRTLMERAAHAVAAYLYRRADLFPCGRVLILCGNGNNGGDGMAAARFIADGSHGEARAVSVLYTGAWDNVKMTPDHTAMLGDKLLTDMLAANRAGVLALMVEPLGGAVTAWQKVLHALQEPFKAVCRHKMSKEL